MSLKIPGLKISQNLLQVSLLMGVNVQDSSCQRSRCEGELRRAHLSRLSSLIFRHIVLRSVSSRMLSMSVRMFGGTGYAAFWSSWVMSGQEPDTLQAYTLKIGRGPFRQSIAVGCRYGCGCIGDEAGVHCVWAGTGNGHSTGRGKDAKFREVGHDLGHAHSGDAKGWVPGAICSGQSFLLSMVVS